MKKLGILLSGRGSNFEAIARSVREGAIPAEIALVVSNRAEAPGLEKAKKLGCRTLVVPSKGRKREEYDKEVVKALKRHGVDVVCLAGFMRILSPVFIQAFPNRILNIHPSLLPASFQHGVRRLDEQVLRCSCPPSRKWLDRSVEDV